jgi:hypothetical protein
MGTYMSAYIEVDHGNQSQPFSDPMQIYSFTEGSFVFGKDYDVFDALAGGREAKLAPEDREGTHVPLFTPRGMPSPCSSAVGWNYFYLVAEEHDLPNEYFWPKWRCIPPAVAAEWLQDKGCHESTFLQWINWGPGERIWKVVSEPETYNASWLWLHEIEAAVTYHGLEWSRLPVEYSILNSAMSLLLNQHGPNRVRLVIWFS